jgi:hydrogenase maturation factor HypF (carbamoyltransferase family)
MADNDIKEFFEDFPVIANAVAEMSQQAVQQTAETLQSADRYLDSVQQALSAEEQAQWERHRRVQMEALEARHPDYQTVITSRGWRNFLEDHPTLRQVVENSSSAEDNAAALDAFKLAQRQELQLRQQRLQAAQPSESDLWEEAMAEVDKTTILFNEGR